MHYKYDEMYKEKKFRTNIIHNNNDFFSYPKVVLVIIRISVEKFHYVIISLKKYRIHI